MRTRTFFSEPDTVDDIAVPPTVKFANGRRCKCPDAGLLSELKARIVIGEDAFVEVNSSGEIVTLTAPKVGRVTEVWHAGGRTFMSLSSGSSPIAVPKRLAGTIRTLRQERAVASFGIGDTGALLAVSPRKTRRPPEGTVIVASTIRSPALPLTPMSLAEEAMAAMVALRCELAEFVDYRERVCIPFAYADNGCQARAHEMHKRLRRIGVKAGKIWCFSRDLFVDLSGPPARRVHWHVHVAPFVVTGDGERVIDPSLSPRLLTTWEWLSLMHAVDPRVVRSAGRYYNVNYLAASKTYELSTDPGGVTLWDLRRYLFDQTRLTRETLRKQQA